MLQGPAAGIPNALSCLEEDSVNRMKLLLILVAISLVAGSLIADYYWRRWMARRRAERERDGRS
jgi:hypothetical protein